MEKQKSMCEEKINLECSGCGNLDGTVNRDMFDGLCAECTNKALYDSDFADKAKKRNNILKNIKKNLYF